jgi:RNA polymerase sigma-70 factor (ECF subfamily)
MDKPPLQLLQDCRKNDRKAHFRLYQWCFDYMLQICRRYYAQEDELKAALNLSFLHLIQSLDRMVAKYDTVYFHAWVKKITVRVIIDEFRKNKRYRESFEMMDEPMKDDTLSSYDPSELLDFRSEIQEALMQLPEMSRAVFNLHAVEGYPHEEIAEMMGISASTSRVHFFRARQKMQRLLQTTKHAS